jgi:MerR family transcriptional regulator, light-induced transcriptional regulator
MAAMSSAPAPDAPPLLRIGELSRRHGVSPDLLRVWERRYGLLEPERSPGGFRLYTPSDEERVRAMRRGLAQGLSAAVAARMALRAPAPSAGPDPAMALSSGQAELARTLESFSDVEAQAVLDGLFATFSVATVLRDVVLPYLRDVGDRWEAGELTVAQEHFASGIIRGRLLGLARGWDTGVGPRALMACPPDEHHDLGLVCFGLALREHGWRITHLGTDTPIDTLRDTAVELEPALVILCSEREGPMLAALDEVEQLTRSFDVALAGRGTTVEMAHRAGARLLQDAPIAAAARIAEGR